MYLQENGFNVKEVNTTNTNAVKQQNQVPEELRSCHTATVEGYVIEGHVPIAEINRLLEERPDILGLAVPGMPSGSPGMENPGAPDQPYDVIAFTRDGSTYIFASYP
ncbi:MAG: DUF411 domain-containing protein [Anaerolineae bacterium]|nr:DUF411 domain-containing protein [Anaerolineae bacterium]